MLAELRRRLQGGEPALVVQALYGLGGVGKTQLAIEYAHRFAADYDLEYCLPPAGWCGWMVHRAADAGGELELLVQTTTADLVGCPACRPVARAKDRRPSGGRAANRRAAGGDTDPGSPHWNRRPHLHHCLRTRQTYAEHLAFPAIPITAEAAT